MGNIMLVDDRPSLAANLAEEWKKYYENDGAIVPKFHIMTIYENKPEDMELIEKKIENRLREINNDKNPQVERFIPFFLAKTEQEERKNELLKNLVEKVKELSNGENFLLALDLHLFKDDSSRVKNNEMVDSMYIYEEMVKEGKQVLLYTSFKDAEDFGKKWKKVYMDKTQKKDIFVYSRESALNYDVLVSSAKDLLNGVI